MGTGRGGYGGRQRGDAEPRPPFQIKSHEHGFRVSILFFVFFTTTVFIIQCTFRVCHAPMIALLALSR